MRCKFCGSKSIHPDQQHKNFSTGKAVVGAVAFGVVGAAAGFIGKKQNGYRCAACGNFSDSKMDLMTENSIDKAIQEVESTSNRSTYDYYKQQYPNIEAVSAPATSVSQPTEVLLPSNQIAKSSTDNRTLKRKYRNQKWDADSPIWISEISIHTENGKDSLSLLAWNQGEQTIRSAYFQVTIYDDAGDAVEQRQIVYQGLSIASGDALPESQIFQLDTNLAYRADVHCEKVAMVDDSVWRNSDSNTPQILPIQNEILEESFPRFRYVILQLETVCPRCKEDKLAINPLFIPREQESFWQCICGQPVKKGKFCPHCGAKLENILDLVNQQKLEALQKAAVKERAAKRAKETMALYNQASEKRSNEIYVQAADLLKKDTLESVKEALPLFEKITGWRDVDTKIQQCKNRIPELEKAEQERLAREAREKAEQEEKRIAAEKAAKEKQKKIIKIAIPVVAAVAAAVAAVILIISLNASSEEERANKYGTALSFMDMREYDSAITIFQELGEYKESAEKIAVCQEAQEADYQRAITLLKQKEYPKAIASFQKLKNYKDSAEKVDTCMEAAYQNAITLMESGKFKSAISAFQEIKNFKDSAEKIQDCTEAIQDRINQKDYKKAVTLMKNKNYEKAITAFRKLGNYKDASRKIDTCFQKMLNNAKNLKKQGNKVAAAKLCKVIEQYDNDNKYQSTVDNLKLDKTIIAVSTESHCIFGLNKDGTVICSYSWRDTTDWKDIVAMSDSESLVVLKEDGTIISPDSYYSDEGTVKDCVSVSSNGWQKIFCLLKDGTVVSSRDLDSPLEGFEDITAISAGFHHVVGLKKDGTVVASGVNEEGNRYSYTYLSGWCDVDDWKDIIAISADSYRTVGLKKDGTVVATGELVSGERNEIQNWSNIIEVSAGDEHTVGLKKDGTVVAAGNNKKGQCDVKNWNNIVAISAGYECTVGLKKDGTVVAVGEITTNEQHIIQKWGKTK